MIVFPFVVQEEQITSSFGKILGWSILIQLFAKFIIGDTAILGKASKKEPLCSCYKYTNWMGWLLKKKALSGRMICQHATILEGHSWALDCFCHSDVFSTINWLISFPDFLSDVFLFHTSESINCRKLPYKYIYYICETIND